jgi:hypothetical protein
MSSRWTEEEYARYRARQPGQRPQTTPEPERAFQGRVSALLKQQGYLVYHTYDSRGSAPGFPDLVACDGKRTLFIELKSPTGKLTPEQQVWIAMLEHAGQEVYVWRPADWEALTQIIMRHANG